MDDDGATAGGVDIISNLPREILCHILSFLPTKYAVGTCILSTKWKNLYSLIPNLIVQLDDTLLLHPQPLSSSHLVSFMCFVNRLLYVTLRDVNSVLAFNLNCKYFNDGQQIGNWVRAALSLNVKEFSLQLHLLTDSSFLFDSLFGCNIVTLHLFLYFDDFAPECRFSLPNLTTLSVKYTKSYVVNALIASCPLLEKLIVDDCICSFGEKLQICSPSLKALKLYIGSFSRSGEIELDTPKLGYLSCCGLLALNYSVRSLNSLWGAYFDLDEDAAVYAYQYGERAIELVKACSNAGCLGLSDAFISILRISRRPLPSLQKLKVLTINKMDSHGWELLPSFVDCAPNLVVLVAGAITFECYKTFKEAVKETFTIQLYEKSEVGFFFEIQRKS